MSSRSSSDRSISYLRSPRGTLPRAANRSPESLDISIAAAVCRRPQWSRSRGSRTDVASVLHATRRSRRRPARRSHGDGSPARSACRASACCSPCLTGKVRSGCRGPLCERDVVSEAFELFDQAPGLAFGVAVGEVVAAEVAVGLAGGEHVPDRADHRVLDGAERALVPAPRLEPSVLGFEVVALDADGGHGGFLEREVQPLGSVACLARAALAGRFVVAGAAPGP